jgi:hypothetical protein
MEIEYSNDSHAPALSPQRALSSAETGADAAQLVGRAFIARHMVRAKEAYWDAITGMSRADGAAPFPIPSTGQQV